MALQTDNLTVGYGNTPLIADIALHVRKGEIMTLIGANGSGKSTILKTISGYLQKLNGKIFFNGTDTDTISQKKKSEILSVMLTDRISTELMTCRDVVETGRYPYTGYFGILSADDRKAVDEAIRLVDMQNFAEKDFSQVSDGQKQRVMLAKAICQEPDILILDEPTSYLDIYHKIRFLEVVRQLADVRKTAVVISMHELDFAQKISDYTVGIKDGEITHYGRPCDIFTREIICELFSIPENLYTKYFSCSF